MRRVIKVLSQIAISTLSLLFLCVMLPFPEDPEELKRFDGRWDVLVCDLGKYHPANDLASPPGRLRRAEVTVGGASLRLTLTDDRGRCRVEQRYQIRVGKRPRGEEAAEPAPRHLSLLDEGDVPRGGIYRFEGDELRVCWRWSHEDPLPTDFTAGPSVGLLVLRRRG